MGAKSAQKLLATMQAALCFVGYKAKSFAKEEHGASDVIAVVAIAAVAVALAVVFRTQVSGFISSVVSTFQGKVTADA